MASVKTLRMVVYAACVIMALYNIGYLINFKTIKDSALRRRIGGLKTTINAATESRVKDTHGQTTTGANITSGFGVNDEVRHVAFLKVHKAGSSTIQNILFRFGYARNLTFVLSKNDNYISKSKFKYHDIMPLSKDNNSLRRYDILCNHAVFNPDIFKQFLYRDAKYFAIIRRPLDRFISAAYYYRYVWSSPYLRKINADSFMQSLLRYPNRHEPKDLVGSHTFNQMTRDFGYVLTSTKIVHKVTKAHFQRFLNNLSRVFKFVLLMESFDESLILLKRHFRWSIKDIIYLKNNVYHGKSPMTTTNLTTSDLAAFRKNQWMDIQLYEHFADRFKKQVMREVGFEEEVQCFKRYLSDVEKYCTNVRIQKTNYHVIFPESMCSTSFSLTREQCELMALNELPFHRKLVKRHQAMLMR